MSYGMVESRLWTTYDHGVRLAMCITQPINMENLVLELPRLVFVRYPAHFKGYVMYREHPHGGMTEIESRNVDFLEDEFPSIGEIKKDFKLYEL